MRFILPAALGLLVVSACVAKKASTHPHPEKPQKAKPSWNQLVATSAQWHLGAKPALKRDDCSGLVCSVLKRAGNEAATGNARTMWAAATQDERIVTTPKPGDLAFFDYTYDKNRNGKVDDPLTHIGVVLSIDGDTITVLHRSSKGITPLKVTPTAPAVHKRDGEVLNDFLRKPGYGPKNGKRLAGQLLRGFARPPRG